MSAVRGNRVRLATFKLWNFSEVGYDIFEEENGTVFVNNVWCTVCAKHRRQIEKDSRIRGQTLKELDRYCVGTNYVSKYTVLRHLKSTAHTIASQCENGSELDFVPPKTNQPRIDHKLINASRSAYQKLLRSAYIIAVDGAPLTCFKTVVKSQKANGVLLIDKTDSGTVCRKLINSIATAIRQKIREIISSCSAFSCLTDGSQARKTGAEKEIIMVRLLKEGESKYFLAALADIGEFGEADAATLKQAIDHSFTQSLGITDEAYIKRMSASTSDGASVNTGVYNGLLTRMKVERPWLITIHCASHRMELAIKDSLAKNKHFKDVQDLMIALFYTMKQSGKFKRHFQMTARALEVQVYSFPKVHGTRFISHQYRGVKVLLNNWIPLAQTIENSLANNTVNTGLRPKLEGFLKKLSDYRFVRYAEAYSAYLGELSKLSQNFEEDGLLVHEILPEIEQTKAAVEELTFQSEFTVVGDTITKSLLKRGHKRRKADNQESVVVSLDRIKYLQVESADETILGFTETTTENLIKCLDTRFKSFKDELFVKMRWIDPANWNSGNLKDEIASLTFVADHFKSLLSLSQFTANNLKVEWRKLKLAYSHFYQGFKPVSFWKQIMLFRRSEFANVCLLAGVVMSLGCSNAVVEREFSHLTNMLNDKRLSLLHSTMENLLLIRANHLSWTAEERDMIIETALDIYLTKKRKTKIDQTKFNLLGIRQKTKKRKVKEGRTDSGITINLESDDDISSEDETIFNSEVVSDEAEETNSSTDDFSDDTDSEFEGFHPSDID